MEITDFDIILDSPLFHNKQLNNKHNIVNVLL